MSVVWHDVECGAYSADLGLWEELATAAGGTVLDLGCGTGRVALHLARRGHEVVGLDLDGDLVDAFNERAAGLPAKAETGDARRFELEGRFALALAPMQLMQLLAGERERTECMGCLARHLSSGGRAALAIVDEVPVAESDAPLLPDVREIDGWVYSSLPLDAHVDSGAIVVRRLRQTVTPSGEIRDEENEIRLRALSAPRLEEEAEAAGLRPVRRYGVPATEEHVGSTVVLLEKGA